MSAAVYPGVCIACARLMKWQRCSLISRGLLTCALGVSRQNEILASL